MAHLKTVRVLRLEAIVDGERSGIFNMYNAPVDQAVRLAVSRRGYMWPELEEYNGKISPYRHPGPGRDVPAWNALSEKDYEASRRYYCAFASTEQLLAWFDSEALRQAMNDVGIVLYEYEVPEKYVMHGTYQVMFRKDLAREISHSPVPTLAGMQVEPAAIAA